MFLVSGHENPHDAAALAVSVWALGISAVTLLLSGFVALRGLIEWRRSGALVRVVGKAWRSNSTQHVQVSVVNDGRSPITLNWVLLYATGNGRKPDRDFPALYMGSAKGEELENVKQYRLDGQSSLELSSEILHAAPFYGLPRYWVDVELATGKTRVSGWIKNEN